MSGGNVRVVAASAGVAGAIRAALDVSDAHAARTDALEHADQPVETEAKAMQGPQAVLREAHGWPAADSSRHPSHTESACQYNARNPDR